MNPYVGEPRAQSTERVYCRDCRYYDHPSLSVSNENLACVKYAAEVHLPTHKRVIRGDVGLHNANNNCEGFMPKQHTGPCAVEIVADDPEVAMSIGAALLTSALIMTVGAVGAVWLL